MTRVALTLGLMTWGKEGTNGARVFDIAECEKMLDVFQSYGHNEVDTAIAYCQGTSEEYLGQLKPHSRGVVVDTKYAVTKHTYEEMKKYIEIERTNTGVEVIDMWYLHRPDRSTPLEETLEGVNKLYKEGYFKRFGVSNYTAWEVAHMVGICDKNDWIKPSAYQGVYNAVHRLVEEELFPCLKHFGISFYAYNPLAGGLLAKSVSFNSVVEAGSRYDASTAQGKNYRGRYWNETFFQALEEMREAVKKNGFTLSEVALRWMEHHSQMTPELADNILIGASSVSHLEQNLKDCEKGPLPDDILSALDKAWEHVRPVTEKYWRD